MRYKTTTMSLPEWLDHIDKVLFMLIQHDSDHGLLDKLMPLLREPLTWIPFYAFMLYYSFRKGGKKAWIFIVLSIATFAITDSLSSQILKPLIGRARPCYDPVLRSLVRGLVDCGGMYSMPSSHAANHFGLATFWYFAVTTMTGKKWGWLWIWAIAISYAQVYVGKHYPLDILAGALTGYITGMGMFRLFLFWWNRSDDARKYKGRLVAVGNESPDRAANTIGPFA